MSFEDGLPPAYEDVVESNTGVIPSAPIAVLPQEEFVPHQPIGFAAFDTPAADAGAKKEQEARGYGATNQPDIELAEFDPEDDRPARTVAAAAPEQRGGKEFVIRFTCPSCDCSNLVPHCGSLTCCKPGVGCFQQLLYVDSEKEAILLHNYSWSKITDRHFLHFFRKPEDVKNDTFAKSLNSLIFLVFLVCTIAMFLVSPWAAIIIAILSECEDDLALRPLLASFGAVAMAEAFLRVSCYLLHKVDRPKRAIKELESPDLLFVPLLVLFFVIVALRVPEVTSCSSNFTALNFTFNASNQTVACCDDTLITTSLVIPIAWLVFEVLIILGVSVKFVFAF